MLDEVVERRGWIDRTHFLQIVSLTNLLPGPNSSETAIHIGYTQRGWSGALVTGLVFLLPTFVLVTTFAHFYFAYGALPGVEPIFWGLKPVIVAVILTAGLKLGRTAVDGPLAWALATVGATVSALAGRWIVSAMVLGGLVTWLAWRTGVSKGRGGSTSTEQGGSDERPRESSGGPEGSAGRSGQRLAAIPLLPVVLGGLSLGGIGSVFLTHLWIGSVLFGGGYVLIALLEPYAVGEFGWLTTGQFLDGVALTQAMPGPISTLSAFVGFAAAGVPGAIAGTAGIYLPAFFGVLLVAPHLERLRSATSVEALLKGVSAVVAGAIVGVAAILLPPAVDDPFGGGLLLVALGLLVVKRTPAYAVVFLGLGLGALRLLVS